MPRTAPRLCVTAVATLLAGSFAAFAEPLDLKNPSPRAIAVRFESSPRNDPATLDREYGPLLPARLEPAGAELVRIVIDGAVVEQYLFGASRPVPGSFGDFVWLFDTRSGHVLDARLEGRIVRSLDWGLVRTSAETRVHARMSTRERAGFLPPRRVLGNRVFRHCDPSAVEEDCRAVEAIPFDPVSGYVNAVGVIEAQTSFGIHAETFSPLGEAIFIEIGSSGRGVAPALAGAGGREEVVSE